MHNPDQNYTNIEKFLNSHRVSTNENYNLVAMGDKFIEKFFLNESDYKKFNKYILKQFQTVVFVI